MLHRYFIKIILEWLDKKDILKSLIVPISLMEMMKKSYLDPVIAENNLITI